MLFIPCLHHTIPTERTLCRSWRVQLLNPYSSAVKFQQLVKHDSRIVRRAYFDCDNYRRKHFVRSPFLLHLSDKFNRANVLICGTSEHYVTGVVFLVRKSSFFEDFLATTMPPFEIKRFHFICLLLVYTVCMLCNNVCIH